jgi:predicted nucleic acid-binding Zn ribbon protein
MSDIADRADWRVEQDIQNARAHVGKQVMLASDGHCHFCDEQVAHTLLFCNVDCRDDYDKEQAALRRTGMA